jgi:hypothetical protein
VVSFGFLWLLLLATAIATLTGSRQVKRAFRNSLVPRRVRRVTEAAFIDAHPEMIAARYPGGAPAKVHTEVEDLIVTMMHGCGLRAPSVFQLRLEILERAGRELIEGLPDGERPFVHALLSFMLTHPLWRNDRTPKVDTRIAWTYEPGPVSRAVRRVWSKAVGRRAEDQGSGGAATT